MRPTRKKTGRARRRSIAVVLAPEGLHRRCGGPRAGSSWVEGFQRPGGPARFEFDGFQRSGGSRRPRSAWLSPDADDGGPGTPCDPRLAKPGELGASQSARPISHWWCWGPRTPSTASETAVGCDWHASERFERVACCESLDAIEIADAGAALAFGYLFERPGPARGRLEGPPSYSGRRPPVRGVRLVSNLLATLCEAEGAAWAAWGCLLRLLNARRPRRAGRTITAVDAQPRRRVGVAPGLAPRIASARAARQRRATRCRTI